MLVSRGAHLNVIDWLASRLANPRGLSRPCRRLPHGSIVDLECVRDAAVHRAVCDDIAAYVESLGCTDIEVFPSSITGGDGNAEFFVGARRG